MTDQFPPPSWFPRPATWPYWPSPSDTFTPPQPANDPWNQINAQWWQQPGTNSAATTTQPNDSWDRTVPAWPRSAMPPIPSGGILGSFPQPNDATDESTTASPRAVGGILAQFDRWNDPQSSSTGRGILAPLEQLNVAGTQTTPAWPPSAAPFGANFGSSWPAQQSALPWGDPGTPAGSRVPVRPVASTGRLWRARPSSRLQAIRKLTLR
jgi:hypothetical protein